MIHHASIPLKGTNLTTHCGYTHRYGASIVTDGRCASVKEGWDNYGRAGDGPIVVIPGWCTITKTSPQARPTVIPYASRDEAAEAATRWILGLY
jgi:hypothetical protein